MRTRVPGLVWETAEKYGAWLGIPQTEALQLILRRFAYVLRDNAKVLGPEIADAIVNVRKAAAIRTFETIDVTLLHRNDRAKSGYEGVYVNGQGFRAMAPDPKDRRTQIFLGLFDSAESAAWTRYQHHLTNGIPYGAFAAELDRLRKDSPQESDEDLIDYIVKMGDMGLQGIPDGLDTETLLASRARVAQAERDQATMRARDHAAHYRTMGCDPKGHPYPRHKLTGKPIFPEDPLYAAAIASGQARFDPNESSTEQPER